MHVHLIGVCGTGMGALAGWLRQQGHRVTGSDIAFYPPMGEALTRWGVETLQSYDPAHLHPAPDCIIVGNVCRPDNPEARAALQRQMPVLSFPAAVERFLLDGRRSFVIAGTHGKTTTTTLLAYLLDRANLQPGFLVGGLPLDFEQSVRAAAPAAPFVIEGDEYDSAFFEKTPKFWRYRPHVVALTSLELDHIDIYADMQAYRHAFIELVRRIPDDGLLVAYGGDPEVRGVAQEARCPVRYYALQDDACGEVMPTWMAAPVAPLAGSQPFDLFVGGSSAGRMLSPLFGAHNIRNTLAALAMATEGAGASLETLRQALPGFMGVQRRQQLRGVAGHVRVYDDFAHHPSAVSATLAGMRARHPEGRLFAVFEPRSATASRRLHQHAYGGAFDAADRVLLAPVGRPEIPTAEQLDVPALAEALTQRGKQAEAVSDVDGIVRRIQDEATAGDTVVIMSNGAFGGIHDRLLVALATRHAEARRQR